MGDKAKFLNHFFERISEIRYAAMGLTVSRPDEIAADIIQIAINRDDTRKILTVLEFSPYLKRVRLEEKPFCCFIHLKLSNGQWIQIQLIYGFVRKGIQFMNEKEVLNDCTVNSGGVKVPGHHLNFEYVWLIHCLNKTNVPNIQQLFFSQYNRNERSAIFAHIRSRYFLELNVLDELYTFHKKTYHQVYEKIIRRKENIWIKRNTRKTLYAFYSALNLIKTKSIKVQFKGSGYHPFSKTERARVY